MILLGRPKYNSIKNCEAGIFKIRLRNLFIVSQKTKKRNLSVVRAQKLQVEPKYSLYLENRGLRK